MSDFHMIKYYSIQNARKNIELLIFHNFHIKILFFGYINMNNKYITLSLYCIIVINCLTVMTRTKPTEGFFGKKKGFSADDFNPAKLIDNALGELIDLLLGSVPILKDIHKKVEKKSGLFDKVFTTFYELFISLMSIIFTPIAAIVVMYLAFQLFLLLMYNIPLLFEPNYLLKDI